MSYRERIAIDPHIRSGKPCIRGTRITVTDVFDYLGGGMTITEVLDDFPDLTLTDIQACFDSRSESQAPLNPFVAQLLAHSTSAPPQAAIEPPLTEHSDQSPPN